MNINLSVTSLRSGGWFPSICAVADYIPDAETHGCANADCGLEVSASVHSSSLAQSLRL